MGWDDIIERDTLKRIVALLWSLASIADLAVHETPRRRYELICLLRRAEASGLRVAGLTDISDADVILLGGTSDPAEAERLAANLRSLAMMLGYLAASGAMPFLSAPDERHRAVPLAACAIAAATICKRLLSNAAIAKIPLIDTS